MSTISDLRPRQNNTTDNTTLPASLDGFVDDFTPHVTNLWATTANVARSSPVDHSLPLLMGSALKSSRP